MAARRRPSVTDHPAPKALVPICRNVTIDGRRTSIRMEPVLWDCLSDICRRERRPASELIALIDTRRGDSGLTAALRVFILSYFQNAASLEPPLSGFAEGGQEPLESVFDRALGIFGTPPRQAVGEKG